ncbi:MAG: protein tyrosine phosphatase family protein [Desulfatitalea sp.]
MINTVKSILRFYKSVISKYSPIKAKDKSIESIVNYIKCNDGFSFSGQPTKHQFSFIRREGYEIIINLAPYDLLENPLKGEESIVTELGMKYVHIPVNMLNPAQEDFDAFVNIMKNASDKKIWVHCAIGMRASAFLYKYRCSILGEDRQAAIWDLREIWEPFGAWQKFLF